MTQAYKIASALAEMAVAEGANSGDANAFAVGRLTHELEEALEIILPQTDHGARVYKLLLKERMSEHIENLEAKPHPNQR